MSSSIKELFRELHRKIKLDGMLRNTEELLNLELGQTFECYHASARRAYELLTENKIPNAEIIPFPADGKTAFQDKITPIGWRAGKGKITILKANGIAPGFIAADYEQHPFHLIKGSTATAAGGETLRIITEEQMMNGADPHDAIVLVSPRTGPGADFISRFLDLGARGFISDYAMNAADAPDGIQWCNAYTEKGCWHVTAEDRPFIGFSVTPATGTLLRGAAARGEILAEIESDGSRYETTVDVVTALIPGRRSEEFWIFAHLYEPLSNDNSSGVAAAIETARLIMERGTPEFSLRVLFGLELYGFAAYADRRGNNLSGQVIGGIDYDAMYLHHGWEIKFNCAAPGTPFFGNWLFEAAANQLNGEPDVPKLKFFESFATMYDDDCFLGDSTTGIPTLWPIRSGKNFWHNSKQTMDYVEPAPFAIGCAINAAIVCSIVNPVPEYLDLVLPLAEARLKRELEHLTGSQKEHLTRRYDICMQDLENFNRFLPETTIEPVKIQLKKIFQGLSTSLTDELPHSPWRDFAKQIVPRRLRTGFPFNLAAVPYAKRKRLPGSVIYGPLAPVLSNMDGKRNLAEILRSAEHEIRQLIPEPEIKTLIQTLFYLSRYGYVSTGDFKGLCKEEIVAALRSAGIRQGDLLTVHSSLTSLGYVEGGAETVFEALKEAVGPGGTFMAPCFTSPFINIGGTSNNPRCRPYDHEDAAQVWTGALPCFMMKQPGVFHSNHLSHSWCIFGPLAADICGEQKLNDAPCDANSPLMRMMHQGGKIVHLGNAVSATTFLHCIEDALDLPGIQDVLCTLKTPFLPIPMAVPRNLPGCRDFYQGNHKTIKFFLQAGQQGFEVLEAKLGLSSIKVMDMQRLFHIGCEIARNDPFIFLCDTDKCLSCRRLKLEYLGRRSRDS